METEVWEESISEPGYQVSNQGQVRKLLPDGTTKLVKQNLHPDGYMCISGGRTFGMVHRLVAEVFCENDDPIHKKIVDHINNDKTDNRACNLEWITQKENVCRAKNLGYFPTRTKIRCQETGKVYKSFRQASEDTGIRYESIRGSANLGTSVHGLHFERVIENE